MPCPNSRIGKARGRPVAQGFGKCGAITRHSASVRSVWYRMTVRLCRRAALRRVFVESRFEALHTTGRVKVIMPTGGRSNEAQHRSFSYDPYWKPTAARRFDSHDVCE